MCLTPKRDQLLMPRISLRKYICAMILNRQRRAGKHHCATEKDARSSQLAAPSQDEQPQAMQETQPPRMRVFLPEGQAQQPSAAQSTPSKVQANMLRTSRATSDSDEEPPISRACCVRAQTESYRPNEKVVQVQKISEATDGMPVQETSQDQIKYDSPELESGKYYVVIVGMLKEYRCKIVWKNDHAVKELNVGCTYVPIPGEQLMHDDLPELED